jgi:hypothetical protein
MKSILLSLFGFTFFCLNTFGGPIKVGNGGGLGEMKILALFENLKPYLKRCQINSNPCALSKIESQVLDEIDRSLDLQILGKGLVFEHGIPGDFYSEGGFGDLLWIDSQSLYDSKQEVAKSTGELGKVLLTALSAKSTFGVQPQLGQKVFDGVQENLISWKLASGIFHLLQVQSPKGLQQTLAFEDQETTHNLTSEIVGQIPCEVLQWQLSEMKTKGGIFVGKLSWICADGSGDAAVLLLKDNKLWRLQFKH